ncbi:MAG: diacylglycerol kinase family lipid kinase [Bacteroidetes bacterium]|nr:diacylglycerol kinase family lipid kinase [Bacteroidota bacterium]
MKIKVIINPISGTGKQKGVEDYIAKHLDNYEIVYTKKSGDASKISKDAVKENFNAVIAVGGDGTVNECLKSLINTNTALGVIPCGSGNGFAYHIGMKRSVEEAIKQLKNAKIETIDSCSVNGIPFVNVAGIGFDAHVSQLFAKLKKRGFFNYVKLIVKELNYKAQEYNITYDGIERKVGAYMISFANSSQYGNDVKISPMADIQDGLLDFVIVKEFPKWKIPFFLLQIATGKVHLSKYVEIIQAKKMEITTNNTLLHLDGEPYKASNPVIINLLENSLKILKPNE